MTIFGFSDECGNYEEKRTTTFIRDNPYYLRATVFIDSSEYKRLETEFKILRQKHKLPEGEIKWSYLWTLRSHQRENKEINETKKFHFLRDIDYHILINYVTDCINVLNKLKFARIIYTVTDNSNKFTYTPRDIAKMHLTTILERTQYEFQKQPDNLVVLFFDPVNDKKDKQLRDVYFEVSKNGSFVQDFFNIKDSLNLEYSHHSIGIQLADYLAGSFMGTLKGYEGSIRMFKSIGQHIRRYKNTIYGSGVNEIPHNSVTRQKIKDTLIGNCR